MYRIALKGDDKAIRIRRGLVKQEMPPITALRGALACKIIFGRKMRDCWITTPLLNCYHNKNLPIFPLTKPNHPRR
jgi:hypothetical protein